MAKMIAVEPNVQLDVEDVGSGRPLVLIHGWPVNRRMFEYQLDHLPRHGYRCISYDLRGFGLSDKPWEGYVYNRMADDLRAILDALDLHDVALAGFSMGGAIAIRYMSRHAGARISQLALLGAAAPCFTRRPDYPCGLESSAVDDLIRQCYADRPAMLVEFGKIFFNTRVSPATRDWLNGLGIEASGHATAMCAVELCDADLRADLAAIRVPSLILHAVHDQVCQYELAEALHAGIRGSQLVPFDFGGHGFFFEEKDRFNDELRHFLDQAPKRMRAGAV